MRQEYRKLKEDAINFFKKITSLLQSCLYHQYLHPNVLKQIKNISEQIQQIINFAATQEQSSNPDDAKVLPVIIYMYITDYLFDYSWLT